MASTLATFSLTELFTLVAESIAFLETPDQEVVLARLVEEIIEKFPTVSEKDIITEALRVQPAYQAYCTECSSVVEGISKEQAEKMLEEVGELYCKGCSEGPELPPE
jgi:hypothetical protein